MNQTLALIGEKYKLEAMKQWKRGSNVEGQRFSPLSSGYKSFKQAKGKSGKPDLEGPSVKGHTGGLLIKSLKSQIVNKGVKISLNTSYAKYVAERNINVGLWGMSTKFRKKMLKFIFKRLSPL